MTLTRFASGATGLCLAIGILLRRMATGFWEVGSKYTDKELVQKQQMV